MFNRLKLAALSLVLAIALALISILGGLSPSKALVTDPNKIIPSRSCGSTQNTCYERVTVNFNDPRISSGVWFATIPKNAFITAIDAYVVTAFNAASTNVLTVGATATANEVVASGITAGTPGVYHLTTAAGLATAVTSNTTYQTALNGNVPLYVKYAQTGTAATAGVVTIVIQYAKNDDN